MYTSIALLALSGVWTAHLPVAPTWERDYRSARLTGERLQRPLAVFLGSGDWNWRQLTREGTHDAEVARLLSEQYVRVYVNIETPEGRKVAQAFGLTTPRGLVISDRTGELQAFRHDGDLAAKDLAAHLARYSNPDHVVRTTETVIPVSAPAAPVIPATYQIPFANYGGACRT